MEGREHPFTSALSGSLAKTGRRDSLLRLRYRKVWCKCPVHLRILSSLLGWSNGDQESCLHVNTAILDGVEQPLDDLDLRDAGGVPLAHHFVFESVE